MIPFSPIAVLSRPHASVRGAAVLFGAKTAPSPYRIRMLPEQKLPGGLLPDLHVAVIEDPRHPQAPKQTVYLLPQPDTGLVSLACVYHTGTADESPDKIGISHKIEHLLFNGSGRPGQPPLLGPGQYAEKMERTRAEINAATDYEFVNMVAIEALKRNTSDTIAHFMAGIQHPVFLPREVRREDAIITSEIAESRQDLTEQLERQVFAELFGPHPYNREILGTPQGIRRYTAPVLAQEFARRFGPNNRSLIILGDFEPKTVLKQIAQHLELPPGTQPAPRPIRKAPPQRTKRVEHTVYSGQMGPSMATLVWAYRGAPMANTRDALALALLNKHLGGSDASLLNQDLMETHHLATNATAQTHRQRDSNVGWIELEVPLEKREIAKAKVEEYLTSLKTTPVTPTALRSAKNALRRSYLEALSQPLHLMDLMSEWIVAGALPQYYGQALFKTIDRITAKDIQRAAQTYLAPGRQVFIEVLPNRPASSRRQKPASGPALRFSGKTPAVRHWQATLPGGARLQGMTQPSLDGTISLTMPITHLNTKERAALILLNRILFNQTRHKDKAAFSQAMENHLGEINGGVTTETYLVTAETQLAQKHMAGLVRLLTEALTAPNLLEADFNWQREAFIQSTRQHWTSDEEDQGQERHFRLLYPPGHPAGLADLDLAQAMAGLTLADLTRVFHKVVTPANMHVAVAGPLPADTLMPTLSRLVRHLDRNRPSPATPQAQSPAIAYPPLTGGKHVLLRSPNPSNPMATIFQSFRAPVLTPKERAAVLLLESLLADGLNGRLYKALNGQSRDALCYTVHFMLYANGQGQLATTVLNTAPTSVPEALKRLNQVFQRLIKHPVGPDELASLIDGYEKRVYQKRHASHLQSTSISQNMAYGTLVNEPLLKAMRALTPADLQTAARRLFGQPSVTSVLATAYGARQAGLGPKSGWQIHPPELPPAIETTAKPTTGPA